MKALLQKVIYNWLTFFIWKLQKNVTCSNIVLNGVTKVNSGLIKVNNLY